MSDVRCSCHALAGRVLSDGRFVTLCRRDKREIIFDPASVEPVRSLVAAATRLRLRQRAGLDIAAEGDDLDAALAAIDRRFTAPALVQ